MTTSQSPFLPPDYEVPQSASNYMKLKTGENKLRVLASPTIGNLGWSEESDDSGKTTRRPIRKRIGEDFSPNEAVDGIKHFWALPVWNYADGRVQILELTQKTIFEAITTYNRDSDYGHPSGYDLVITRKGEKLGTEYNVLAKPPKPVDVDIAAEWERVAPTLNMELLFEGKDPFDSDGAKSEEKPRATEDRETTIKAIFTTAKKLWPTISASPEPKETLKKKLAEELDITIASFSKATLEELSKAYMAMKGKESDKFAEDAKASLEPETSEDGGPLTDENAEEIPF